MVVVIFLKACVGFKSVHFALVLGQRGVVGKEGEDNIQRKIAYHVTRANLWI